MAVSQRDNATDLDGVLRHRRRLPSQRQRLCRHVDDVGFVPDRSRFHFALYLLRFFLPLDLHLYTSSGDDSDKYDVKQQSHGYMGFRRRAAFSPSKLPLRVRGSGPPSNARFLGPIRIKIPNEIWIGSSVFARIMAESHYTLQWDDHFLIKIAPLHSSIWTSIYKNPSGDEIANVNFHAVRPEATRIR